MTANITHYLAICPSPASDNIIFTLKTINPNYNKEKVVEEFKLYGKEYCEAVLPRCTVGSRQAEHESQGS